MRLDESRKYRSLNRPNDRCDRHGNERVPGAPPQFPERVHAECVAKLSAMAGDLSHPNWAQADHALLTLRRRKPGRQRQGMISVWASAPEAMKLGDALRAAGCFPDALEDLDRIAKRPAPAGVALDLLPSDHGRYLADVDPSAADALAVLRDVRMRSGLRRIFVPPASAGPLARALTAIGGYRPTIATLEMIAARAAPEPTAAAVA